MAGTLSETDSHTDPILTHNCRLVQTQRPAQGWAAISVEQTAVTLAISKAGPVLTRMLDTVVTTVVWNPVYGAQLGTGLDHRGASQS